MYLIDTNVISEARKVRANPGVFAFFDAVDAANEPVYLSAISIGELRRGVELIRHRGDLDQTALLENWLAIIFSEFSDRILAFSHSMPKPPKSGDVYASPTQKMRSTSKSPPLHS